MEEPWLASNATIRLSATLSIFILFALLETLFQRRSRSVKRSERWIGNWALQFISAVVLRYLFFWILPVAVAIAAQKQGAGLLNLLSMPDWVKILLSLVLLDFAIYWQHRFTHRIPLLWRLHRLHHSDIDLDVTSALRFHPLEIIFSVFVKSALVWLLGVPVVAIILFAVLLNGMAIFNHANLKLPLPLDKILRYWVVTPDMHRVHHSVIREEHDSNFGFNLSCWDRLFGSYQAQPRLGHLKMEIGLDETNGQQTGSVMWMLLQPFR